VEKSLFSREGNDIKIVKDGQVIEKSTESEYAKLGGKVYQEYVGLPEFQGSIPIIGSWIVGGESAGIGIREDTNKITKDTSRFIPHYFE
jgi:glutathionylspermidine synthase